MIATKRRCASTVLGSTITLCLFIAAALAASAASTTPSPASLTIGVVDHASLEKSYDAYKLAMQKLQDFKSKREEAIHRLEDGVGLSSEEFKEYRQQTASDVTVDKQRLKELQTKAKQNMDELQALDKKKTEGKDLTKDEQSRFDELKKCYDEGAGAVSEMYKKADEEIKGKEAAYLKKIDEEEGKAYSQVGKDKKLGLMLRKDIQVSEDSALKFVLYGGTDITDDVLKALKENFKATMFDDAPTAQPAEPGH